MSTYSNSSTLSQKRLTRASWQCEPLNGDARLVLERIESGPDTRWYGIASTTVGALSVVADKSGLRACGGQSIDFATMYELRLWVPSFALEAHGHGLWARELRWLNGSHIADLRVFSDPSKGEMCWCRAGEYVQHSPGSVPASATMPTVEVFCEEQSYSNVVFVDELMTGKWA